MAEKINNRTRKGINLADISIDWETANTLFCPLMKKKCVSLDCMLWIETHVYPDSPTDNCGCCGLLHLPIEKGGEF